MLLEEVRTVRSTVIESSGKWVHFAVQSGSRKTTVRALAPTRWNFFTRTGEDILKQRELITAYVDSHQKVAEKLGWRVLPTFFEQLRESVTCMSDVFDTKMLLLEEGVIGAALYAKGLLDHLRGQLGAAPARLGTAAAKALAKLISIEESTAEDGRFYTMAAWSWPFTIQTVHTDLSPTEAEAARDMFTRIVARCASALHTHARDAGSPRRIDAFA
jgi:hypothetical protein